MAIVCIEQRPHLFLMTQSNCFLVNAPVYMAILMYEASILMLSADRSMAYMKPMIYRIKSVKYAIKLCTCSSILIILELSTIYIYQAINNGPVYCISTGAGMNPNSQSHRWINTQGNVQANPNLDTAQKRWLTTFKESQKPFFRLLLFLSISSLALGTPFGL
uniref:G-protein coupled receptors family 1 profile domain-containing protein n=1 Tax=Romanomermis culicivorax TaxID=13658 RepID=A0A915KC98_ROMCU